jgi:hypothetical protein
MNVTDLEGTTRLDREYDLKRRLRTVRKGDYGAFILWHVDEGAHLWVHINKEVAYLHFWPDNRSRHPGYQATGMSPGQCDESVHFLLTTGDEADSIDMPADTLVPVEIAYRAATEFLHEPVFPPSVTWFEL